MYAPNPDSNKLLPFFKLTYESGEVEQIDFHDASIADLRLNFINSEKWASFVDYLSDSLQDRSRKLPIEKGEATFENLARTVCNSRSSPDRKAKALELYVRPVEFSTFMEMPKWGQERRIVQAKCY